MKKQKIRLDLRVQDEFPHLSRTHIQSLIMQGKVIVEDHKITKSGAQVAPDASITVNLSQERFVSRAGYKLEHALKHFNLDVSGLVVLDAGLSTGGFTDCLLQAGAKKVYGVDVGYGQVHEKIRQDPRVVVMERTNLRQLEGLDELVDLVTLDLSFISLLKVMHAVTAVLKPKGTLVVLIKPQFEARRDQIGKGGIISDPKVHQEVIDRVTSGIVEQGFEYVGITESPILGSEGNKEFLAYFRRTT